MFWSGRACLRVSHETGVRVGDVPLPKFTVKDIAPPVDPGELPSEFRMLYARRPAQKKRAPPRVRLLRVV